MNIALEQTKEYVNGMLHRTYGDAFIRGNNGIVFWVLRHFYQLTNLPVMYISADS